MLESILSFVLSHLIELVIAAIGSYISVKVVPWLKKIGIYYIVRICVKAAEKLGETAQIAKEEKKNYVIVALEQAGIEVSPLVETMIESAVKELDEQKDKITQEILEG